MNKLFCGICLALLLSSNVWAGDVKPVEVEVLAKTGSSWDGRELPDYHQRQTGGNDFAYYHSAGGGVAAT